MIHDPDTDTDALAAAAREHAEQSVAAIPNSRAARRVAQGRTAQLFAAQLDELDGPTTTVPLTRSIFQED